MKFIHLSDLHLGKRVNEYSMLEDQEYILKKIINIVDAEKPDGVIIAGDVYDKSVPAAEAAQLFDNFLVQLAKRKLEVFVISGNHDSPERIAFGSRILLLAPTEERKKIFRQIFKTQLYQDLQDRLKKESGQLNDKCDAARNSIKQYIDGITCDENDVLSIEVEKAKNGLLPAKDVMDLIDRLLTQDNDKKTAIQMFMDQLSLTMNELEAYTFGTKAATEKQIVVKAHERKRQSGNVLDVVPEGTPTEVVEHRLPEEERICSACGSQMVEIGKEVRRTLQMKPAKFWVRDDVYYTYACKNCEQETGEANIVKAAKEPALLPGSFASAEAAPYLAAQKFVMHSPLYRWNRNSIVRA